MAIDLNDTGERIRLMIWSGFYTPEDVFEAISEEYLDPYELSADDRAWIDAKAEEEANAKSEAEEDWPETTDWDRLDAAFNDMDEVGILALHNAGMTQSDGMSDAADIAAQMKDEGYTFKGYVFYHSQDVDGALQGAPLHLAFGAFDDGDGAAVAHEAVTILQNSDFEVEWDGTLDQRIALKGFDWKKPGFGEDDDEDGEGYEDDDGEDKKGAV